MMRHDGDGRLLEIGARTRTIPPALRRALQHRDRGCRFPGCGVRFGQGHHVGVSRPGRRGPSPATPGGAHIRHWAQGGPTTLSNLVLLCRRHHRVVHEEGYQVEREPDGALAFRRPDRRALPDVPPPAPAPADPVEALRAQNHALGLQLHAWTACPTWLGERLDLAWALDVLHPAATQGAR
ncbi:MAG TPA: HNH endonuclease signature motif containing protein [Methylomirabilota bacterium]|jgi:hypothetical protein|nr:HNH endonuclease signature motif containing protein [Methylomirabilota bacterium]